MRKPFKSSRWIDGQRIVVAINDGNGYPPTALVRGLTKEPKLITFTHLEFDSTSLPDLVLRAIDEVKTDLTLLKGCCKKKFLGYGKKRPIQDHAMASDNGELKGGLESEESATEPEKPPPPRRIHTFWRVVDSSKGYIRYLRSPKKKCSTRWVTDGRLAYPYKSEDSATKSLIRLFGVRKRGKIRKGFYRIEKAYFPGKEIKPQEQPALMGGTE